MLKASSSKSQFKKLLARPSATPKAESRSVTTHHLFENNTLRRQAVRDFLDTNSTIRNHVGTLKLNREHRYNTLTPNYVKNIRRAIDSLNQETNVKLIYLTGDKGEHFSNGTDFRTIMHYKSEKGNAQIVDYLNELYGLQTLVAKINKPIVSIAPGHAFNSGAALFSASSLPITTLDSQMSFNEASFGFTPHGGTSFYLSRLPGEFGTFLALTGLPIVGIDAKEFQLADQIVHENKDFEEELAEIMYSLDMPIPNVELLSDRGENLSWNRYIEDRDKTLQKQEMNDLFERARKKHENIIYEEFQEPKDKVPSLTANSDYQYKKLLEMHSKSHHESEPGYLEHQENIYQNYFNYVLGYVKQHVGHPYPQNTQTFIKHKDAINRCFYSKTVEEITENLKQENSDFARLCLDRMQKNSMLSMKIALKMLREAKNKDYKGALATEFNVALNKIQDKEFDLGISEVLMKPGKFGSIPDFDRNISNDQVLSFFEPNKWSQDMNLDVVSNALLPTRFYYEKFSDQVRLWINEESTPQSEVREQWDIEVKEALRDHGIDIRDRALTMESARDQLHDRERFELRQQEFNDRLNRLVSDDKLRDRYYGNIKSEIQKLDENPASFYQLINSQIQELFENAYLEKLNKVYEKSVEAHNLEKRRMYIKFKKFLFQSRILTYANEEADRVIKQLKNMPFKEIHLTEKWDQSMREMEHPELQKSFMWHLSKAIGKKNITPPELAKQYLTNTQAPMVMNLYTFDKEELQKLRRDVIQNPDKYEQMLTQNTGLFKVDDHLSEKLIKDQEYEYWFRVLNDGRAPVDSLPYYRHYLAYKEFVENVEKNSLNTLKMTVSRLLMDFENNQENLNAVADFEQVNESKAGALRRLLSLVNDQTAEKSLLKPTKGKKKVAAQEASLVEKQRPISDIKKIISNLAEEDKDLNKLFMSQEHSKGNSMVSSFREEAINSLCQLLEVALLNNRQKDLPKDVLEQRYAALINPKNSDKSSTSLRIIDAFLSESNSESVIREAIDIVKPYYFYTLQNRINEETRKVLDAVKIETTSHSVLLYYLFNINHPDFRTHPITTRIQHFNQERDRESYIDTVFPEQRQGFVMKQFMSMMGKSFDIDPKLKVQDQEYELDRQTKEQYKSLKEVQDMMAQKEQKWSQDTQNKRQDLLKKPFSSENTDLEIDNTPGFNFYNYNIKEIESLITQMDKADNINDYIEDNDKTIRDNLSDIDWLHIYANAIKEYDMDMQATFRHTLRTKVFMNHDHLKDMQDLFSGNRNLTWNHLADYATFLEKFTDSSNQVLSKGSSLGNIQKMKDFMIGLMDIVPSGSAEQQVRQNSVFFLLKDQKYQPSKPQQRKDSLRQELSDFSKLQQKIYKDKQTREDIEQLLDYAPRDLQNTVLPMLESSSKYLNLNKLHQLLRDKQYSAVDADALIDKDSMFRDVKDGKLLQEFIKGYGEMQLDVVSLAEAKTMIESEESNKHFEPKLRTQIKMVLDYVGTQLKYVSHDRRKEISLGEFMNRHHHLNASSLHEFTNDILKNQIQQALGEFSYQQQAEVTEWEFGGHITNPSIHSQQNEQDRNVGAQEQIEEMISQVTEKKIQEDFESEGVLIYNKTMGHHEIVDGKNFEFEQILRDARDLTKVSNDFESVRAYYENEIMSVYSSPDLDQEKLQQLITDYTRSRLQECMLKDSFAKKVKSQNGHIYLKALKEQIADELKLSEPTVAKDLSYENFYKDSIYKVDVEGKYNTSHINNLDALGYDNFKQRLQNVEQNRDLAHETPLDKLLAEYFLDKRGEYVKSKELIEQLNKQFDNRGFAEGHPLKTNDPNQIDQNVFPTMGQPQFTFNYLKQNVGKEELPSIQPSNYTSLMELDIATAQAIQEGKNGMSEELRKSIPKNLLDIPEHFQLFDAKKPPKQWVEDKLMLVLNQIFEVRRAVEKTLNRRELVAYDQMLAQYLVKEQLIPRLTKEMDNDYNSLHQLKQLQEMKQENEENEWKQVLKTRNKQMEFNKGVKDEDALYKFLTYSGMLEKKRREDVNKTRKDNVVAFGIHNFEEFYKEQLLLDAKKPARKINPEDFKPVRGMDATLMEAEVFRNNKEREQDYFKDFETYKENKKEQQDRNQLFFILEQFFSHSKTSPDPMNKAQQAINDYFKDTENTYFFDKNKIQ